MINQESLRDFISVDTKIQHGQACLKGTRLPVYVILEALATGSNIQEIRQEYGPVTQEQIQACLYYASLLANEEEVIQYSA